MTQTTLWSASEDENTAIEGLSGFMRAMAELLHANEAARYIDPCGGHVID